ncbi:MAG: hypothetical protein P4L41_06100 [Flavipsychrobacter sp.]|nr:hypothetical protein [Flavipsychrobacter sp.]
MSDTQFGFLPWMRKGIVSKINQVDGTSSPTFERAQINVDVTLHGSLSGGGTSTDTITNTVELYGPGDITGIDPNAIIRTEPTSGSFNFDDNYLPYIEFYEEDFLWRYTPAISDATDKLRPWLALVVLSDNEYTAIAPVADGLPPSINIIPAISTVLHPTNEHWAWAHVCVSSPDPGAATSPTSTDYINNLKNDLNTQPDIAVCRLMCSRRLAPNTQYTAFLIPAFETGRLAGLTLNPSLSSVSSLLSSWTSATQFPVYYQWRFGTSALGDFESLARALKPRVMDPSLGGRAMDISNSGMGLNGYFSAGASYGLSPSVTMEGALMPSSFVSAPPQVLIGGNAYTTALNNILNMTAVMKNSSYTPPYNLPPYNTTAQPHPYVNSNLDDDPVVTPPIYGQWHAGVQQMGVGSPTWLQQLNLDPRYRAAAGLGALAVRKNKQAYMQIAWEEIGEVLLVNNKINKMKLAIQASQSIYQKHFIGNASISTTIDETKANDFTKIGGLAFKKIDILSATYTVSPGPITPTSYSGHISALKATTFTNLTTASVNSGFRKLTRNRSFVVSRANAGNNTLVNSQLIANINTAAVAAALPFPNPPSPTSTSGYVTTVEANNNASSGSSFATANSLTWTQVYVCPAPKRSSYDAFNALITNYTSHQNLNAIFLVPIQMSTSVGLVAKVQAALQPSTTITDRISQQIELEAPGGLSPLLNLNSLVMAYPVIDQPMFNDLMSISAEYILPNLSQYPNNTVTILETNTRFIESYMAGLNHEFARELLWQEYPTDQRGSYFRRFWDINDTVNLTGTTDFMYDIDPMHKWGTYFSGQVLGQNNYTTRHTSNPAYLVLLIRGDLLKKYPNALIYAQKADPAFPSVPHQLYAPPTLVDAYGNPDPSIVKFPVFKSSLQPDIVLLGFDLSKADALGNNTAASPGWFFVFRERPGQMRFGLEEPPVTALTSWDELNWGIFGSSPTTIKIGTVSPAPSPADPITWGGNAANMAYILYRDPVMVAIHAESMMS